MIGYGNLLIMKLNNLIKGIQWHYKLLKDDEENILESANNDKAFFSYCIDSAIKQYLDVENNRIVFKRLVLGYRDYLTDFIEKKEQGFLPETETYIKAILKI
jgi:hypothetical protein